MATSAYTLTSIEFPPRARTLPEILQISPADRTTDAVLDSYFEHPRVCGNADTTIVQRFVGLRFALQWMYPGRNFRSITHPQGFR